MKRRILLMLSLVVGILAFSGCERHYYEHDNNNGRRRGHRNWEDRHYRHGRGHSNIGVYYNQRF